VVNSEVIFNDVEIRDTESYESRESLPLLKEYKHKALIVVNGLNQAVNVGLAITRGEFSKENVKSVATGTVAVISESDLTELGIHLTHHLSPKVVAKCSVAPTTGKLFVLLVAWD